MLSPNQSDLLVNLDTFSKIACLDGRLFGVETLSDKCSLTLNACLRSQALESLVAANRRAEADLGYDLVPRYYSETLSLRGQDLDRILTKTNRPGVAAVNVRQDISPSLFGIQVSPYVGTATVSDSGNGYCIATVPAAIADNPAKITLRDEQGRIYRTEQNNLYPRKVGSDWQIAIIPSDLATPCNSVSTVNVQHNELVHIDISASTVCNDCNGDPDPTTKILPVYPGTNEFIPLARPVEHVGSFYRYWIHVWMLVDPAFADEQVDLTHAEFYKLRSTVDFVCVREVAAPPEVVCYKGSERTVYTPNLCADPVVESKYSLDIAEAKEGLLALSAKSDVCSCGFPSSEYDRVEITFYYKTDPAVLGFALDLSNIATAIAYRAAADLPSGFCGCEIKTGFIYEAQKSFGDARVNPMSGETIWVVKFGHTFGHLMYEQKMASAPKYQQVRSF